MHADALQLQHVWFVPKQCCQVSGQLNRFSKTAHSRCGIFSSTMNGTQASQATNVHPLRRQRVGTLLLKLLSLLYRLLVRLNGLRMKSQRLVDFGQCVIYF